MIGALCVHANNYMFFRCTDTPLTMANDVPSPFKALWNMEAIQNVVKQMIMSFSIDAIIIAGVDISNLCA
jgi:hypothetical protein